MAHESRLYYEFSHLYDRTIGRVFARRIRRVIRSLDIPPGARVLEVGVGTGASLRAYPEHCEVVGIDLAPEMLAHAERKIRDNGWRHIRLQQMDAMDLQFPDSSFDYVMAFHVISVVPDARKVMREIERVCRPGGQVVIINHFRSRNPVLAELDRRLEPITRHCGWHTLDQDAVLADGWLQVQRSWKMSKHSLFTIVVAVNGKPRTAAAMRPVAQDSSAEPLRPVPVSGL